MTSRVDEYLGWAYVLRSLSFHPLFADRRTCNHVSSLWEWVKNYLMESVKCHYGNVWENVAQKNEPSFIPLEFPR